MKKIISVLLMIAVLVCGCGSSNKSGTELTDIECFKCQDSIQTVFDVLGETEIEESDGNQYYSYNGLNLCGYNGKAIFNVMEDGKTIKDFNLSLTLNENELEEIVSYFYKKYGDYKQGYTGSYKWDIDGEQAKEDGYENIIIIDDRDGKYTVSFRYEEETENSNSKEKEEVKEDDVKNFEEDSEQESKKTLLSEQYEFDGGTIDMTLSKDSESKYYYTIFIRSEIPWKAAYSYYMCSGIANSDEFKKTAEPSVMMGCGDVFISNIMS